ncbi:MULTISPECIES: AMP-binding protein [unclassified Sphingobium]|uniref:AMP-binding protein n=1 Tax=unclassified Sphingobium TaxID=2611147 RepID=UPI0035A7256C
MASEGVFSTAQRTPTKVAAILGTTGAQLPYGELAERSADLARRLRHRLDEGDRVAILLENGLDYFVAAWAARRSGLRYVPINWHLQPRETAYILRNSEARAVISSPQVGDLAKDATAETAADLQLSLGAPFGAFQALSAVPAAPAVIDREGSAMFYSSGTTGAPKGIMRGLGRQAAGTVGPGEALMRDAYAMGPESVFLSPGPLYHAAPLAWTMGAQVLGGTSVIMPSFDAEAVLAAIERHRVTHALFVPTHFVRMLKLPEAVRKRYDLSSLKAVIHAAAPCPPEVKRQMIDWLGPIIEEFYGTSEGGFVTVSTAQWLERPGTVGRSVGAPLRILDDERRDLPKGATGLIYFRLDMPFEYYNEPEKTRETLFEDMWCTAGDMGYLDQDDYLFLVDRKSNMIISGGVNIYPQEVENVLTMHPAVTDLAVIGVPNDEFGEEVKAVIAVAEGQAPTPALATELIAYCRERLAHFKCPRSVDFVDAIPRLPSGKVRKHELLARYRTGN